MPPIATHPAARVAFAGLSPLTERILRSSLANRGDIELVEPWTRLTSIAAGHSAALPEILFIELERHALTIPLRALLAAASGLRIIALSADARAATVFGLHEQRAVLQEKSAEDLCGLFDFGPDRPMDHH